MGRMRPQKITFGEMRPDGGPTGILIYCADYNCSHFITMSADQWPDDLRLSDTALRLPGLRQAWSGCPAKLRSGADGYDGKESQLRRPTSSRTAERTPRLPSWPTWQWIGCLPSHTAPLMGSVAGLGLVGLTWIKKPTEAALFHSASADG